MSIFWVIIFIIIDYKNLFYIQPYHLEYKFISRFVSQIIITKEVFMKKRISALLALFTLLFSFVNAGESQSQNCACLQYGSFYTTENQIVAPEHPILFDEEALPSTKCIEHQCGTGDFIIKEPGIYRVIYSVSLKDQCDKDYWKNVALTLNGHVIAGSEMYVGEENHLSTLAVLVKICQESCCHNTIRVINNNNISKGWNNILLSSDECYKDVTASIVIERIGACATDCPCKVAK